MQKKPILHALIWIFLYIVVVNIGDIVRAATDAAYATAVLVIAFAALMTVYLVRCGQMRAVGLRSVGMDDLRAALFYLPLALLVVLQFVTGIDPALGVAQLGGVVALMLGVGFVEEVLFRGLLYRAIERNAGMRRAVLVTGITFGLGHIVNLLRGADALALAGQIVVAVAIGIVLALLVAATGSIVPGIVFHICYNIGGGIATGNTGPQIALMAITLGICLLYSFYLVRRLSYVQTLSAQH